MKICQVDPGCGIPIPPPSWGAIEKIVWEFTQNQKKLGHEVDIKMAGHINVGEYDIVHCHVANLANQLAENGIPYIYQLHDHHAVHYGKESHVYKENLKAIEGSLISLMPARFLVDYFESDKCVYFSHGVNNLPITIAGPSSNKHFFNEHLWMLNYPKLELVFDLHNDNLLNLYHEHDIFVHPTILEAGHPNLTMIEAAAAGLPIIALWELETDFHGAWRASRNVFEMDKGLKNILENWNTYRLKTINTGKQLSWENRTKDLLEIYKQYAVQ